MDTTSFSRGSILNGKNNNKINFFFMPFHCTQAYVMNSKEYPGEIANPEHL